MRKTKIVCTLGPSTDSPEIIKDLMVSGMNVARLNFSHGDYESHKQRFDMVKNCREELNLPVATMLDTKGPEIRVQEFETGKIELKKGDVFTLTTNDIMGTPEMVSITYKELPKDVEIGTTILIDDGLIAMSVEHVTSTDIVCRVINGGAVSNRKSINVPSVKLSMPYLSPKDIEDIKFGVKTGFDFIAASFTRSASDILDVKEILAAEKGQHVRIIAKIENAEGVENIDEILNVADGIMVARGDLGVEIPIEDIPSIQKLLIKKTFLSGKSIITATQMLDSMMKNPRPTRAEVTDVANAIYDGTSAIMLSGETAAGLYPVEAVQTMSRIAVRTEESINYKGKFTKRSHLDDVADVTNAISHATCTTAYDLKAKAVITVTKSGQTARMISKYRPSVPVVGCTPDEFVYRQLNLGWGIIPLMVKSMTDSEKLLEHAVKTTQDANIIDNGDLVIITAGLPLGVSGTTNLLRVHIAGDVLVEGQGIGEGKVCGRVYIGTSVADLKKNFKENDILVVESTTSEFLPYIRKASAIIAEQSGPNSHAAVSGSVLGIPTIIGAKGATKILKNDTVVTVEAEKGIVHAH